MVIYIMKKKQSVPETTEFIGVKTYINFCKLS